MPLDLTPNLDARVSTAARSARLQLKLLHQLHLSLEMCNMAAVVHALLTSHLDYCDVLYIGLPLKSIRKLQLVQKGERVVPLLQLHLLSVSRLNSKFIDYYQ